MQVYLPRGMYTMLWHKNFEVNIWFSSKGMTYVFKL